MTLTPGLIFKSILLLPVLFLNPNEASTRNKPAQPFVVGIVAIDCSFVEHPRVEHDVHLARMPDGVSIQEVIDWLQHATSQ